MPKDRHPLRDIIDNTDYKARAYSGRGMGDRRCLGVVIEQGDDALGFAGEVIAQLGHAGTGPTEHEEIAFAFGNAREDQLGKGRIIYFPDIEWED